MGKTSPAYLVSGLKALVAALKSWTHRKEVSGGEWQYLSLRNSITYHHRLVKVSLSSSQSGCGLWH